MTKKHYKLITSALKNALDKLPTASTETKYTEEMMQIVVNELSRNLQTNNQRFDKERFKTAIFEK